MIQRLMKAQFICYGYAGLRDESYTQQDGAAARTLITLHRIICSYKHLSCLFLNIEFNIFRWRWATDNRIEMFHKTELYSHLNHMGHTPSFISTGGYWTLFYATLSSHRYPCYEINNPFHIFFFFLHSPRGRLYSREGIMEVQRK